MSRSRCRDLLRRGASDAPEEDAVRRSILAGCRDIGLDVRGGYGIVTEEVLREFPHARVTFQDYWQPMLDEARRRLAQPTSQVGYVQCELRDPSSIGQVGDPFDLAVSAIAIHNLGELGAMVTCYRGIAPVIEPDALFFDYDLFDRFGGIANIRDCCWKAALRGSTASGNNHRSQSLPRTPAPHHSLEGRP